MKELSLARLRQHAYRSARNESSKETAASPLEPKVLPHAPVSTTTMDNLPSPDSNSMDQISDKGNMECACQPGPRTLMAEYSREEKDVANFLLEMASGTRLTESKAVQMTSGCFPQKFVDTINSSNVETFTGLPSFNVLNALVTCYTKVNPLSEWHQLCVKTIAVTLASNEPSSYK
nr:uncharacterized protein LOC129383128 [Dermacentor andersoni]